MRTLTRLLIVLALLSMVTVTGLLLRDEPLKPGDTGMGDVANALFAATFPDTAGKMQPIAQWRGRVLVVNFWATWCPPCRDEMPELSALQDKLGPRGLTVAGISIDDIVKMQAFAHELPVSYPLLAADFEAMTLAEGLGNDKGILPYTVVLDREGRRVQQYFGRIDPERLETDVLALLAPRP